jgi:hypothetical protein
MLFFKKRKSAAPAHNRVPSKIISIIAAEEDLRRLHALRNTLHNLNQAKQTGMKNLDSTITAVRDACAQHFENVYGRPPLEKDFECQRSVLSMFFNTPMTANHKKADRQGVDDDPEFLSTF